MDQKQLRRRGWAVVIPILGAIVPLATMLWAGRPWRQPDDAGAVAFLAALIGFGLLPYAIAAFILLAARAIGWLWWSVLIYAVIITVAGGIMDLLIVTDDSSTAAIGFIFVPFYQLLGLPLTIAVGAVVGYLTRRSSGPSVHPTPS